MPHNRSYAWCVSFWTLSSSRSSEIPLPASFICVTRFCELHVRIFMLILLYSVFTGECCRAEFHHSCCSSLSFCNKCGWVSRGEYLTICLDHVIGFRWNRSSLRIVGFSAKVNEHDKLNVESISNLDDHIAHGQTCNNRFRIRKFGYGCVACIQSQWLLSDSSQSHWKLFYDF